MLDIQLLRDNTELVKTKVATKNTDPALVDDFLKIDKEWRLLTAKVDELRAKQKELSSAMGGGKPSDEDLKKAKENKEELKVLEEELSELEGERKKVWMQIPNLPDDDVPVGKDESENVVIRKWGEPKDFDFEPKDHLELGELLGIIDTEKASVVSGARFAYLKGDAALLQYAIISWVFNRLTDKVFINNVASSVDPGHSAKPFVPVVPPMMIKPDVYLRMARLEPVGDNEERYYLPKDDMYLIGSAEHTLGPLHMDETLFEADLPARYVGMSAAFRREAGSYGKDTRGILRVHQFDKLEIESFTTPAMSHKEQDFIVALQEHLLQELELPYQVIAICTGDMGGPDARQIDINTWMPSQGKYRETHTSDLVTDYQSRRLNTKFRRSDNETELVHMNDATVFAIGRILIAILENNQQADGSVVVPEVLRSYIGKDVIAVPEKK